MTKRWILAGSALAAVAIAACGDETTETTGSGAATATTTTTGAGATGGDGGAATTGGNGGSGATGGSPECTAAADCEGADTDCALIDCDAGTCGVINLPAGTPCDDDGGTACDGSGMCVTGAANGTACSGGNDCMSGFCADSVCCDTACDGDCVDCASTAALGTCTPEAAATDPTSDCPGGTCDGAGTCAIGYGVRSVTFGGAMFERIFDLDRFSNGDFAVIGLWGGDVDFLDGDGVVSSNNGTDDIFVSRITPSGSVTWSVQFGGDDHDLGLGIAVDAADDVYVTGAYRNTMTIGTDPALPSGPETNAFVAKLSGADGSALWSNGYAADGNDIAWAVTVAANGDAIVTGAFNGTLDFGDGNEVSANDDGFVLRLASATGNHVWSEVYGATEADGFTGIALIGTDLFIVGHYTGTGDFGGGSGTSTGTTPAMNGLVLELDPADGSYVDELRMPSVDQSSGGSTITSIAQTAAGELLLSATYQADTNVAGTAVSTSGTTGSVLAVLETDLSTVKWVKNIEGDTSTVELNAATEDANGNIIAQGSLAGPLTFASQALVSTTTFGTDYLIVKMASDGTELWARSSGSTPDERNAGLFGISTDPDGTIYTSGAYANGLKLGNTGLAAAGETDAIVAALAP